jgi:hypothetical protein
LQDQQIRRKTMAETNLKDGETRWGRMSCEKSNLAIPPDGLAGIVYFRSLQTQVGRWSQHNFGDQLAHRPAMGMFEELCELYKAILLKDTPETLDAIGDIVIYMADYHHRRGWDMGETWTVRDNPIDGSTADVILQLIGKMCHSHLKGEQNIRGGSARHDAVMVCTMGATLGFLDAFCRFLGCEFISVVQSVWSVVGKRDWKKNPNDANVVAEAAFSPGIEGNSLHAARSACAAIAEVAEEEHHE